MKFLNQYFSTFKLLALNATLTPYNLNTVPLLFSKEILSVFKYKYNLIYKNFRFKI